MKKIGFIILTILCFSELFSQNPYPQYGAVVEILNKHYVGNSIEFDVMLNNLSSSDRYLHSAGLVFKFNSNCFNSPEISFKNITVSKLTENFQFKTKIATNLSGEIFFGATIFRLANPPAMYGVENQLLDDSVVFNQAKELLLTLPSKSETPILLSHFVVTGIKDKDCIDNIEIKIDNSPYLNDFASIIGYIDREPTTHNWSITKFYLYHNMDDVPDPNQQTTIDITKDYSKDIKIIPNPVMNAATMQIPGFTGLANVEIYTPEGSLLNRSSVEFYGADAPLPVDKLSSGWYFVKIYTDNNILLGTKPLVIVK